MQVKHQIAMIFTDLNFRQNTIMWSDGQSHSHYFYNEPTSTPPASNLTVTDWSHFRQLVDKWALMGGNSISIPVLWDWTQYGENDFEFRPYIWALQYAQTKGITVSLWVLPFRRFTESQYPQYNTTTEWSFTGNDREVDSNGKVWGGEFNNVIALGSPKWANIYKWIGKVADAIAPYSSQIEYVSIGTNDTYETSADMVAINATHPDTIAKWQAWHLMTYGTTAPTMALREDAVSVNKIRTAKFMSFIYKEINDTAFSIFKSKMPNVRYIWHGGSMTDFTYLRGCFSNMPNIPNSYDGIKHNPAGDWDAYFETRAIAKANEFSVIEWTRNEGIATPQIFAQKVIDSINAGANGISYSFFDGLYSDSAVETFTASVISILTQAGYWNTQVRSLTNSNTDVIEFRTSEVSADTLNKYLDYRTIYTSEFNASRTANGGNPPTIIWIDDTEIGRSKTGTPSISLTYLGNGISITPFASQNTARIIEIYKDNILFDTLTNQASSVIDRYPLVNARYKVRVRDSDKVWSDFSNQVIVSNTTVPTCNPTGRVFSLLSVNYNAVTRNLSYIYDAQDLTSATWAVKQGVTTIQTGSVNHLMASIVINLPTGLANGNYTFELTGTSCQGTAVLGFIVTGSTVVLNTIYVSAKFDDVCGEGKVCQFGYSSAQTIIPIVWDDATSIKRLQIANGVVTEVSTGGDLYQTKSYDLTAGTYHFFVKEEGAGEDSIIYLGSKIVQ